jgi:hypothetical protein
LIINTLETVPKSTPNLAAPAIQAQATTHAAAPALPAPIFHDAKHHIKIFQGDCLDIVQRCPPTFSLCANHDLIPACRSNAQPKHNIPPIF